MARHLLLALVGLLATCGWSNAQVHPAHQHLIHQQMLRQRWLEHQAQLVRQQQSLLHQLHSQKQLAQLHALKNEAVKQVASKTHRAKQHQSLHHAAKHGASQQVKHADTKKQPPANPLAQYAAPRLTNGLLPRCMLVTAPAQRIHATLTMKVHAPDIQAQEWILVAPRIPGLPSQRQVSSALDPAAQPVTDLSAEQRPLMMARIPGIAGQPGGFVAQAKYQATLMARRLVAVPPGSTPPPVAPLTPAERVLYLASTTSIDHQTPIFMKWLKTAGLRRQPRERDLDFAYRVSRFLHAKFRYDLVASESASKVCLLGRGDCGGLSMVFIATLRANGVPARMLAGRHAVSSAHGVIDGKAFSDVGYHCIAEFFAAEAGWVPVDAAGVVGDPTPDGLVWFGAEPGQFLTMHIDTDLVIDSVHFGPQALCVMQTPWFGAFGQGTYRGLSASQVWQVEPSP